MTVSVTGVAMAILAGSAAWLSSCAAPSWTTRSHSPGTPGPEPTLRNSLACGSFGGRDHHQVRCSICSWVGPSRVDFGNSSSRVSGWKGSSPALTSATNSYVPSRPVRGSESSGIEIRSVIPVVSMFARNAFARRSRFSDPCRTRVTSIWTASIAMVSGSSLRLIGTKASAKSPTTTSAYGPAKRSPKASTCTPCAATGTVITHSATAPHVRVRPPISAAPSETPTSGQGIVSAASGRSRSMQRPC